MPYTTVPQASRSPSISGSRRMRTIFTALLSAVMALCACPVLAQQAPASPAESDPAAMGWMEGSPPPPDKRVLFRDGGSSQFPKTRWSFAHIRELAPTARVSRGTGPVANLPIALRDDLDAVTFTPLGEAGRTSSFTKKAGTM